ncbi:MAG: CtsR family transcriptional regulator [Oscillospiraceae bacterium]|nr:CtsR family transcriptional regulator [Oscillospiraceae bacterium]MDD4546406.1 CtsR family transcriptional regulator [Oscillospiraceae bacterium]
MRLSDEIAAYILHMMESAGDGEAELKRNELAEELGCVPSQINYVLTSRFSPEQGYIVESRRGGGGYIRVRRVKLDSGVSPFMHIVNAVGYSLNAASAQAIIENLLYQQIVSPSSARIMLAALSDQAYRDVSVEQRDKLRASLLKQMLTALIT